MSPMSNPESDSQSSAEAQDLSKGATPSEANATPSSTSMSDQENNIGRQIHRLDRDLSDAASYQAQGREELSKGDTAAARRDFRNAEHILKMATGGKSFQPTIMGENPRQQQVVVEDNIAQAQKSGVDVSDAQHYLDMGKDALTKGDQAKASRDFRSAELALGIPVEVGYAEIWEAAVPVSEQQNAAAAGTQSDTFQAATGRPRTQSEIQSDINQAASQGKDVTDAQAFLNDGEQAQNSGDQSKAQRDFRAAERSLGMSEAYNTSGSSNRTSDESD
ncbi:hypothetical protein [Candidatus Binatus sp.]|uniref:hypothetical protein n=1 Tax=Candidatus Binatus sp. TaxID=2811406 RepID=UPI003BAECCFD